MHSLEEENILLNIQLEKNTHVVKRQQETIKDYESHFILLTNKIDELTQRLHKGTASHIKESNSKKSQLATLPDDLWKRSNKSTMHPYEIPKKKKEFEYVESSRCKHERAKMIGDTCTCCAKYYNDNLQITSKERIQMNSRHRTKYQRPKTPPGFWDMDFPSDHE